MASFLVLVVPLLLAGTVLAESCNLSEASTETFDVTTAHKKWYQQYRYSSKELDPLGCLILTQDPGDAANQMKLNGAFSKDPSATITADITIEGNRLHSSYYGKYGETLTAERNLVYGSADIFIEHFCMKNGDEMTFIFTTAKHPSPKLVKKIWKEVNARPEIAKSKFHKVHC